MQQINKEEIAIDNLKAKYNQLASGEKVPTSLTAMETQVKKTQGSIDDLIIKKNQLIKSGVSSNDSSIIEIDNQVIKLEQRLDSLDLKMNDLKLDPSASQEAQNLKSKIDLAEKSLNTAKDEANNLASNIKKASQVNLGILTDGVSKFGDGIKSAFVGKGGISGKIETVSKKIDSFKSRITKMVGAVMIFRLLRSAITSLSNGLTGMLKSNDTFANSLNQIKVNLITAFAPIYNYVLPALNSLMNVLSKVTGSIASFMASLFGQTADQAKKNAEELYNQANAQNAVTEAEEGSLASFDKLEVNGADDSSSSSSSSSSLDFSKDIQTSSYLDKLLDDLKNKIGNGLWFDAGATIANELNSIIDKIDVNAFFDKGKQMAANLCNGINGFVSTFNWAGLATKVSDAFKGILGMILTIIQTLDFQAIGKAIGDFFLNIDWGGIARNIIDIFFASLCGIGDLLIGLLDSIISVFNNPDSINKFFEAGVNILLGIVNGIGSVFAKIGEIFMKIIELFLSLFGIHSPSTVFADFGKNIIQGLINGISGLIDSVLQLFVNLLNSIKNVWQSVSSWFNSTIVQPIKNVFSSAWTTLQNGAKNAWNGIKNVFSSVATFFKTTFTNAWNKVKAVFSTGGKIFDGIKDGIVNAFKSIVNTIISGINKVIKTPFDGINSALKKIKNIDILGAKPFKSLINTISVPQIPMLATGAVIPPNAKFLAMLGDQKNGRNLEAPESLLRKIVREESGQEKEITLNATFIVQCETEEIGRAALKGIRLCEDKDGKMYLV